MIQITFTIGIGKDKDGKVIPFADQVLFTKRACYMVAREFGGFTATVGDGGWVSPNKELVEEDSLSISTTTDKPGNRATAKFLALGFKELFNQNCIMVTRKVVQCEYV
jgi:hypothetical protein